MIWLWNELHGHFGQQWIRDFGDVDGDQIRVWQNALSGLTGAQLKNGIDQAQKWEGDFPPNVGQFMKLCLTKIKPSFTDKRIAAEREAKSLSQIATPKQGDSELVKTHKAIVQAYLRGDPDPFNGQTKEEARKTIAYYTAKQRQERRI